MTEPILIQHRDKAIRKESQSLFKGAALSRDHSRHRVREDDHRLPYKRDVDRIVHSRAYARYIDKTQVAYLIDNDHITHRVLHVQLVSNFARGVAEILRLNGDLVEAIALGHDVGHPPFGHEGEAYLSALAREAGSCAFAHPYQSCRLLSEIEPLNLGLAVYDGFLCHDGGLQSRKLVPHRGKSWEDHFEELERKREHPGIKLWPGTLEGCLVKLSDTVSYLGRDIEDAIRLGIVTREDVPETCLGRCNREMLSAIAGDIIRESYEQDCIAISEEVFQALKVIRSFNFKAIYSHPLIKVESPKVRRSYSVLFSTLLEELRELREQSTLWRSFVQGKPQEYIENTDEVQMVIDFIAGMTDSYFIRILERVFVPQRQELDSMDYVE